MKSLYRFFPITALLALASSFVVSASNGQSAKRSYPRSPSIAPSAVGKRPTTSVPRRPPPPEMKEVEPGTPAAERLALLRAKVRSGEIPTVQLGGFGKNFVVPQVSPPENIGTRLIPSAKAAGETLAFQKNFIEVFSKLDPRPASRIAHYSWLPKIEHVRQLGWCGAVRESHALPDGTAIVKVRIYPSLYSPFMKTAVFDYVDETYAVADGQFQLLDSDAAIPKPHLQSFPPPF